MQSFINDLVTPGKLDCLQVKRRCGAVLRERSWKQIKFYVYNRVLKRRRMQSTEWRSDRQLIVKTSYWKKLIFEEEFFLFTWSTCIFYLLLMQTDISVNWLPKSQEILPTQVFSYLLCLFFVYMYIKRIHFLTMCLIFFKIYFVLIFNIYLLDLP